MKKSFAEASPVLLERWDYDKNTVSPYEIGRFENRKVWLRCPICGNVKEALLTNIHDNSKGCGVCRGNKYYFLGKDGTYAIYCHTTPDGKKYIGMTNKPIKIRFGNGANYQTKIFKEAIERFGWENIKHEIIEYGLSEEEASVKEIKYINLFNTLDPNFGYNIATGGTHGKILGRVFSEETRKKISDSRKGRKASAELRAKLSEAHKGLPPNHTKAVIKCDLGGKFIEEYNSIVEATKQCGGKTPSCIARVLNGSRKTAYGFIWKYKD